MRSFILGIFSVLLYFLPLTAAWKHPEAIPVGNRSPTQTLVDVAFDHTGNAMVAWLSSNGMENSINSSYKPIDGTWQKNPDTIYTSPLPVDFLRIAFDTSSTPTAIWISHSEAEHYFCIFSSQFVDGKWQQIPRITLRQPIPMDQPFTPEVVMANIFAFDKNCGAMVTEEGDVIKAATFTYGEPRPEILDTISSPQTRSNYPSVASDHNGGFIAIWRCFDGTNYSIQTSYKPCGGKWQLLPDTLCKSEEELTYPKIIVDRIGNATAVWISIIENDPTEGSEVLSSYKPFNGSWQCIPDSISFKCDEIVKPQIAVDLAGNIIVVWIDSDGLKYIVREVANIKDHPLP